MIYLILGLIIGFIIGYLYPKKTKKQISSIPFIVGKVSEEERKQMHNS
jgi:uncharacterized membrane-anchored protein YhcB (DUF1043 family)